MIRLAKGKAQEQLKGALVALACVGLNGCMSTTVIDEHRTSVAREIKDGESVVVLGRRHRSGQETEIDFVSCVGSELSSSSNSLNVIPEKEFVDSLYPYFETSTAPMDVTNLGRLVENPAIAQRFSELNLRYFVWIDGFTETVDKRGSMSCAVGPGGGGCFGFTSWDDSANYEATIWDFKQLDLAGKISAKTTGTSYVPAIILPIPLLARVQTNACKNMADQIASQLGSTLR